MAGSEASGVEQAVFGLSNVNAIRNVVDDYVRTHLDADIAEVIFRAGRIDAVWAVRLSNGRAAVLKAHRPPVDVTQLRAIAHAQRMLVAADYACSTPLAAPAAVCGVVITAESMAPAVPLSRAGDPSTRRVLAQELARHVHLLSGDAELVAAAGPGPAWCRFQDGPWPRPHDSIFDFRETPRGYEWLDAVAALAATALAGYAQLPSAVGHADWCLGNVRIDQGRLVASFDWGLVAAPEPFIVGFAAAGYTDGGAGQAGAPDVSDVTAFLADYDHDHRFDADHQHAAAAAATWVMAYNARCQLSIFGRDAPPNGSALTRLRNDAEHYLSLQW